MKTATKNLEDDHVHILKLIEVMIFLSGSEKADIKHLENIVDIIRNFADGVHHTKEEKLLFPLLATRGFSPTQGPVAVMLHEHQEGRNFVKGMAGNISLYKNGNIEALKDICSNMMGYADLLKSHIAKENNVLFRMADNVLSESDQADLLKKFDEAEQNQVSSLKSKEYIKQIDDLASYYKI